MYLRTTYPAKALYDITKGSAIQTFLFMHTLGLSEHMTLCLTSSLFYYCYSYNFILIIIIINNKTYYTHVITSGDHWRELLVAKMFKD